MGGGHGLAASLAALRHVSARLTGVVTVADNGGSSGRLRAELGVLPPGDLRQALAALCGDDEWGRTWASVLQHRFRSGGDLHDHALGNLLIVALWELLGIRATAASASAARTGSSAHVAGLDWVARLLGARGRVLPMSAVPLDVVARVRGTDPDRPDDITQVRGQVEVASTRGRVVSVALDPPDPPACPEAVVAVHEADWVVVGPGLLVHQRAAQPAGAGAVRRTALDQRSQDPDRQSRAAAGRDRRDDTGPAPRRPGRPRP